MELITSLAIIVIFIMIIINYDDMTKLNYRVIKLETIIEKAKLRGEIK